jgi:hypothetical protein
LQDRALFVVAPTRSAGLRLDPFAHYVCTTWM